MRNVLLAVLALCIVPAIAAEITFEPIPRIDGAFVVVLEGVEGIGQITLLNLDTDEVIRVALRREGDQLITESIAARRTCRCTDYPAGIELVVEAGHTLVAATTLGGGLSTAVVVGPRAPRPGEPVLALRAGEEFASDSPADRALRTGIHLIEVHDAQEDTTCGHDEVRVLGVLGSEAFYVTLQEAGATSGRFTCPVRLDIVPDGVELRVVLSDLQGGILADVVWHSGIELALHYGDQELVRAVEPLTVLLSHEELVLPVDCKGDLCVRKPESFDEVRWYIGAQLEAHDGACLRLGGFRAHPPTIVTVQVRTGIAWGTAWIDYEIIPRASVSFVPADMERPADAPWSLSSPLRVRLEHVHGDPAPRVLVGRLGGTQVMELELAPVERERGVFQSAPLTPCGLNAGPGDVIYVQYKDPTCHHNHTHRTLPIR